MEKEQKWIERCLAEGAYKASVIEVSRIPFDPGLRKYCEENSCGHYDSNYACPPSCGEPQEVIAKARSYQKALVFQTVGQLEDSLDIEGMMEAGEKHKELSLGVHQWMKEEKRDFLLLTAGGCSLCPVCAKRERKPCRFPELAFASLEAYCVNVSSLAPLCGMKYINGQNTVTYFSAVFYT